MSANFGLLNRRRISELVVLLSLLSFLGSTAEALTRSTLVDRKDFLREGPQRSVVGLVVSHRENWAPYINSGQEDFCTAVILDSHTILTAAHCLAHTEIQGFRSQLRAFMGPNADERNSGYDEIFELSDVHLNPHYDPKSAPTAVENLKHDLAIVKLRKALPAFSRPVTLPGPDEEQPLSQEFILIGYGTDHLDSMTAQDTHAWGHLRTGRSHFADWNPERNSYTIDQERTSGICKGDSGSPALRETSNGYELIALARNVNVDSAKLTPSQRETMAKRGVMALMESNASFDFCQQTGSFIDLRQDLVWILGLLSELPR